MPHGPTTYPIEMHVNTVHYWRIIKMVQQEGGLFYLHDAILPR